MIIIHMIQDISFFYINYQQGQALGGYVWHCIPELLTKTVECITEKLETHSFSGLQIVRKITIFRIIMKSVWLKIAIFAKTKKGLLK